MMQELQNNIIPIVRNHQVGGDLNGSVYSCNQYEEELAEEERQQEVEKQQIEKEHQQIIDFDIVLKKPEYGQVKNENDNLHPNQVTTTQNMLDEDEMNKEKPIPQTTDQIHENECQKKNQLKTNDKENKSVTKEKLEYINQGMPFILRMFYIHILKISLKLNKIIKSGRKLTLQNVPHIEEKEKVEYNSIILQHKIQEKFDKNLPLSSFAMVVMIFQIFSFDFVTCIIFLLIDIFFRIFNSVCMQNIIQNVQDENDIKLQINLTLISLLIIANFKYPLHLFIFICLNLMEMFIVGGLFIKILSSIELHLNLISLIHKDTLQITPLISFTAYKFQILLLSEIINQKSSSQIVNFNKLLLINPLPLILNILESLQINQPIFTILIKQEFTIKWGIGLACCLIGSVIVGQKSWYQSQNLSAKLRLSLVTTLFSKVNSLSSYSIKQAELSKIVNIVSNDMNLTEMRFPFMFISMVSPFALIFSGWILIDRHGPLGVLIIVILVGCLPIQNAITKKATSYIHEKNKHSDDRIKLTNEIIEGIRLIKMYAWENAFIQFITTIRSKEMKCLLKQTAYNYIGQSVSFGSALFAATIPFTLIHYFGESHQLSAAKIFASMQIIMFLRIQVMLFLGFGFSFMHESKILLQRFISIINVSNHSMINLDDVKKEEDIQQEKKQKLFTDMTRTEETLEEFSQRLNIVKADTQVRLQNFSAWWNKDGTGDAVLKNLNVTFKNGQLNAVVGLVGSGKSSLLYSLIKETPAYRGVFQLNGSVSYSKQEPYIFSGTIRDNILFGKPYHEEWYNKVVKSCCLLSDFDQFSDSDRTEIGEKGTNLSGGQKARISLARAVYSNTDIFLLDDPLSAVDSKVAKKLVKNVFKDLLKDKLIILVTHQLSMTKHFDHIVILEKGSIFDQGDHIYLENKLEYLSAGQVKLNADQEKSFSINSEDDKKAHQTTQNQVNQTVQGVQATPSQPKSSLFSSEDKENINVTLKSYGRYFKFDKNTCTYIFIFWAFVWNELVLTAYNRILAFYDSGDEMQKYVLFTLLGIFTVLFLLGSFVKYVTLGRAVIKTNTSIHTKMIEKVVRSPVIFFDRTQSGVILNRFSNDMGILDTMIHFTQHTCTKRNPSYFKKILFYQSLSFLDSLEGPLNFLNLLITVSFIQPYFLIIGVIELVGLYQWLAFNKNIIMQSKTLDLLSKSPVFSFFSSTLSGMEIVKVFGQNSRFHKILCEHANLNIRCNLQYWHISRMFGAYTQFITTVSSIIGIFLVITLFKGDSGLVGQSLIYLTLMTDYIQWAMRQIINMDSSMSSVQRSFLMCDLESERELLLPSDQQITQQKWPNTGNLSLENVHMKYRRDLEYTLKGVNFTIESGKKIGCVGRTGAGKSSLIECLFRMREAENQANKDQDGQTVAQSIKFDGQEINSLGLHTLRNQISIIPQTPFIFSGSIRKNLDPLDEYKDEDIITVLKQTQLYEMVSSLPKGVYTDMSDVSSVFSVGQKQLICLARALLKKSKLIIMDEATANMDMVTDHFIQQTIKEKFDNCSVLTIAHRLNTIADYDKVIVMDKGKVVECEQPFLLLADNINCSEITKNGFFAKLVKHTGEDNSRAIFEMAKNHYLKSHNQEIV